MNAFLSVMASMSGRIARIVVGVILIVVGLLGIGGTGGVILAVIGLVPLLAGALDYCVLAPLLGHPFKGADLRAELQSKK